MARKGESKGYKEAAIDKLILPLMLLVSAPSVLVFSILRESDTFDIIKAFFFIVMLAAIVTFYIKSTRFECKTRHYKAYAIIGFGLSVLAALIMGIKDIHFFWIIGPVLTASFVDLSIGMVYSLISVFLMAISASCTIEDMIYRFIICVIVVMLAKYLSGLKNLFYVLIIALSCNVTLKLIVSGFIYSDIFDKYLILELISLTVVIIAFYLYHEAFYRVDDITSVTDYISKREEDEIKKDTDEKIESIKAEVKAEAALKVKELETQLDSDKKKLAEFEEILAKGQQERDELEAMLAQKDAKLLAMETVVLEAVSNDKHTVATEATEDASSSDMADAEALKAEEESKREAAEREAAEREAAEREAAEREAAEREAAKEAAAEAARIAEERLRILHKISDDDYHLLVAFKEKCPEIFAHSCMVARTAAAAAGVIGIDDAVPYAGGLYHEVGRMVSSNYIKEGIKIARDNNFPESVIDMIKQHNTKVGKPKSPEAAVVMLCDSLLSSIDYYRSGAVSKIPSADRIVSGVFDLKLKNGILDDCEVSLIQYKALRNYFTEVAEAALARG